MTAGVTNGAVRATGPRIFRREDVLSVDAGARALEQNAHAYVVIENKVYDVKDFLLEHPGGGIILTHIGKDGTDAFLAFHPESATEILANYYVGDLAPEDWEKDSTFVAEIRALKQEFQELGYFESSKLYYLIKFATTMSILAASIACLVIYGEAIRGILCSALLLSLFWQQTGWLTHDFTHHQVFKDRPWNDIVADFLGPACQGFSVSWWKDKHNTHHAAPNVHGSDPDIDTAPVLYWSEYALEGFSDFSDEELQKLSAKFLLSWQAFYYFPVLMVARLSWAAQSLLFVLPSYQATRTVPQHIPLLEQLCLLFHWTWYLGLMFFCLPGRPLDMLVFFLASQASAGLLLAVVFSLNHNGMPVLSQEEASRMDFFTKQVLTGRDVFPSVAVDWFTGGLNYQIEHHLFPSLPRHNFHKVQAKVQALCERHGVPYHRTNFFVGTSEVLSRLSRVARLATSTKFRSARDPPRRVETLMPPPQPLRPASIRLRH